MMWFECCTWNMCSAATDFSTWHSVQLRLSSEILNLIPFCNFNMNRATWALMTMIFVEVFFRRFCSLKYPRWFSAYLFSYSHIIFRNFKLHPEQYFSFDTYYSSEVYVSIWLKTDLIEVLKLFIWFGTQQFLDVCFSPIFILTVEE